MAGGGAVVLGLGALGAMLYLGMKKDEKKKPSTADVPGAPPPPEVEGVYDRVSRLLTELQTPEALIEAAKQLDAEASSAAGSLSEALQIGAELLRGRAEAIRSAETAPPPDPTTGTTPGGPSQDALDQAAAAANDILNTALVRCPVQTEVLLAAGETFALQVITDPTLALGTLQATVEAVCPATTIGDPSGPTDLGNVPFMGGLPTDPAELAAMIVEQTAQRGSSCNVMPEIISAFQSATGLPATGFYDAVTAAGVGMRLGMLPPAPCALTGPAGSPGGGGGVDAILTQFPSLGPP